MGSPVPAITAKQVAEKICDFGSLPQSLAAVLKIINNPKSGPDDIARVISQDVSLTARLLRMVNSAQYGRNRKVTKISEAVVVMGLNSIKMLALSSSVFNLGPDKPLCETIDIQRIWRHLIETAVNARSIAEEIKFPEPEEAFVTGILHDVGIVIMLLYFKDKYAEAIMELTNSGDGLCTVEKKYFGFCHTDVGAEMIKIWKLPSRLGYVLENHHSINKAVIIAEDSRLNEIIALADRMAMEPFDKCFPNMDENFRFTCELEKKLGLTAEKASLIRKISIRRMLEMAKYLELDVGDIIAILSQVQERMAAMYVSMEKLYTAELTNREKDKTNKKSKSMVA